MNEGWFGDYHFILFSEDEMISASRRYGIESLLPGYTIVGLRGWEDFIVRDAKGRHFTIPTLPLDSQYLSPCCLPDISGLQSDSRFKEKIKWFIKPIVFGGDPASQENQTWISHEQHTQLVRFWNHTYRQTKAQQPQFTGAEGEGRCVQAEQGPMSRPASREHSRWPLFFALAGPLSWILAVPSFLLPDPGELYSKALAFLFLGVGVILLVHVVSLMFLIIVAVSRRRHGAGIGRAPAWGLTYYAFWAAVLALSMGPWTAVKENVLFVKFLAEGFGFWLLLPFLLLALLALLGLSRLSGRRP